MAAKKTEQITEEITEQEVTGQITEQTPMTAAAAQEYDPWKDMRQVYVPKFSRTEQDTLEVGVNDRTYFIPKEQTISVPEPVWEVIEEMLRARKAMEEDARKRSGAREVTIG